MDILTRHNLDWYWCDVVLLSGVMNCVCANKSYIRGTKPWLK